jgi:hypothetical protein
MMGCDDNDGRPMYGESAWRRIEAEVKTRQTPKVWEDYKFKMTSAPEMGTVYRCDYTWFWKTLQYLTASLNVWVLNQAHKRAVYTKLRGPENGLYIDKDVLNNVRNTPQISDKIEGLKIEESDNIPCDE